MGTVSPGHLGMFTLVILVLAVAYFTPTIIAMLRKHADSMAIGALNFLLGWSIVGWIVSLIWSLSDPRGRGGSQTVVVNTTQAVGAPYAPHHSDSEYSEYRTPRAPAPHATTSDVPANATSGTSDADTAFWDGLPNKNDPDALEEYLIRHPSGRFAGLARARLERARPTEAIVSPSRAASPGDTATLGQINWPRAVSETCRECGEVLEEGSRFCSECGAGGTLRTVA